MPNYRRAYVPGGTFFLTVVTHDRAPLFHDALARKCLRESMALARRDHPFVLLAATLLPEHLHLVIALPENDADFSVRIGAIKARFTRRWLAAGGTERKQSAARRRQDYRGVWQKRFWEHWVRDERDLGRCFDYIHYNPVKHGHVACPHAWPWTTFHRFVREGRYEADWCCACEGREGSMPTPPAEMVGAEMD
jgi:putative transposase